MNNSAQEVFNIAMSYKHTNNYWLRDDSIQKLSSLENKTLILHPEGKEYMQAKEHIYHIRFLSVKNSVIDIRNIEYLVESLKITIDHKCENLEIVSYHNDFKKVEQSKNHNIYQSFTRYKIGNTLIKMGNDWGISYRLPNVAKNNQDNHKKQCLIS